MKISKILNDPKIIPYIFISPFVILWGLFVPFPVGYALRISFQKWTGLSKFRYVGLLNYIQIFQRPETISAYLNIIWYVVVIVSIETTVPLLFALLLNVPYLKFKGIFRGAFFLPYLASSVVVSILFSVLFTQGGLINEFLHMDIPWLSSTLWSKPSVAIAIIWVGNGFWTVIYLAALQSVPVELYEAAKIDGASGWERLFYITIPMIAPVGIVVVVMATIWTLQLFAIPKIITKGGPLYSSTTPVLELYKAAFLNFKIGYGAAFAIILAGLIIIVAVLQIKFAKKIEVM